MAGQKRKAWQQFKKEFPAFAQNRDVKADLGPKLDVYEKALAAWEQATKQTAVLHDKYQRALADVEKTVEQYDQVVSKSGNQAMSGRYKQVFRGLLKGEVEEEFKIFFNFRDHLVKKGKEDEAIVMRFKL